MALRFVRATANVTRTGFSIEWVDRTWFGTARRSHAEYLLDEINGHDNDIDSFVLALNNVYPRQSFRGGRRRDQISALNSCIELCVNPNPLTPRKEWKFREEVFNTLSARERDIIIRHKDAAQLSFEIIVDRRAATSAS